MKKFIYILIVASFILTRTISAQMKDEQGVSMKKTGQSTMNFLQVSVVPKAIAVGDAYTAMGKGVESMFYNPAGLSEMENKYEFFLSMTKWIADIQYYAGGVGLNLGSIGTVGLSFVTVDYGDIIGTSLISKAEIATDELGYRETGILSNVGAYAIGLAYSRSITNMFMVGGSVRLASQQLGQSLLTNGWKDNQESNFVFDLGVKYYTPFKSFRFGMSIRNFATSVKYEEITAQLPMTFAVGGAIDLMDFIQADHTPDHALLASVEFSHPNNFTERVHIGMDYSLKGFLSLRCGYMTNHDVAGLSLGFGLFPRVMGTTAELSYTYSDMDLFDDVNRFSLRFAF